MTKEEFDRKFQDVINLTSKYWDSDMHQNLIEEVLSTLISWFITL